MNRIFSIIVALGLYCVAGLVSAGELTYRFTATVTDILRVSGVQVGDQMVGTYTVADGIQPYVQWSDSSGAYVLIYIDVITEFQATLGSNQFELGEGGSELEYSDYKDVFHGDPPHVLYYPSFSIKVDSTGEGTFDPGYFALQLGTSGPELFPDPSISPTIPDFNVADWRVISVQWNSGAVTLQITSFEQVPNAPTFSCNGFGPPMADFPVTVKKDRALPLKAEIFDADGFAMTDADFTTPPVVQVWFDSGEGEDAVDVTDEVLSVGQGDEGNQFVFTESNRWQFNLSTKNYTSPGTYTVLMETGDSSAFGFEPTCITEFVIK